MAASDNRSHPCKRAGGDCNSDLAAWYCIEHLVCYNHTHCIHNLYTLWVPFAMPKEKIINFRIDADLKAKAKKVAENDGRSLSNWITVLIEKEIKKARKRG